MDLRSRAGSLPDGLLPRPGMTRATLLGRERRNAGIAARSKKGRATMSAKKVLLLSLLAALVAAFFALDLSRFLSLAAVKQRQSGLSELYAHRPLAVLGTFFAAYVAVTALSLPGATVMTLAAGATFGLAVGTLLASFASTIGATLAFLSSRHALRESVRRRFGARLADFDAGIERDGPLYLFALRLAPVVPFFVVNLVMGLTSMRTSTFLLVSQAGMLAGTAVYVNAGTQLARIDSLGGILSPGLLGALVLLGLFPLLVRKAMGALRRRGGDAGRGVRRSRSP